MWEWSSDCQAAMLLIKQKLISAAVFAHYDPQLPIKLKTDASSYGLGAVISLLYPNKLERPIARTLTSAERNYAQIEREPLSSVCGVYKFNQYLCGRRFPLVTASNVYPWLQTWCCIYGSCLVTKMGIHCFRVINMIRDTKSHGNADALSRLPLPCIDYTSSCTGASNVFNLTQIDSYPYYLLS